MQVADFLATSVVAATVFWLINCLLNADFDAIGAAIADNVFAKLCTQGQPPATRVSSGRTNS